MFGLFVFKNLVFRCIAVNYLILSFRPENIAELLSETYDTEWQPAFEYFIYKKKVREREAIEELLKILKVGMQQSKMFHLLRPFTTFIYMHGFSANSKNDKLAVFVCKTLF